MSFLLEAQHALGFPIEVISGREEARLVFEGCMHTLPPSNARRLVVDIGGASTEVIVGKGFEAENAESFKVGCVNTSLRFFKDGRIDRSSLKKAQVAAAAELEEAVSVFSRGHWDEAFGSSGTIGAVSDILRTQGWTDGTITPQGLLTLRYALARCRRNQTYPTGRHEARSAGSLGRRRCGAIGGLRVARYRRNASGARRVARRRAVRPARPARAQGFARLERGANAVALRRRSRTGAACQRRLRHNFIRLSAQPASDEMAHRLRWAALLHEVGFAISHNDYHKHAAYLIQHSDIAGFSTPDQERVATLVLAQRGNLKKVSQALEDHEIAAAILSLRLAVIVAHARRAVELPSWSVKFGKTIELGVASDWLTRHPLTQYLLEEEAAHWERVGVTFALRPL